MTTMTEPTQREINKKKIMELLGIPTWFHVFARWYGTNGPNLYTIQENLQLQFPDMDGDEANDIATAIYHEMGEDDPMEMLLGYVAWVRLVPGTIEAQREKDIMAMLSPGQLTEYKAIQKTAEDLQKAAQANIKAAETQLKSLAMLADWDWLPQGGLNVEVRSRDSWDNALLEGYAIARPEILAIKKTTRSAYIVKSKR